MKTAAGAGALELYRDRDSLLPLAEYVAKFDARAALAKLGHTSWDACVATLSKQIAVARPDAAEHSASENLRWGLEQVQKRLPAVWANYLHERGR